jgi:hypothetical protein
VSKYGQGGNCTPSSPKTPNLQSGKTHYAVQPTLEKESFETTFDRVKEEEASKYNVGQHVVVYVSALKLVPGTGGLTYLTPLRGNKLFDGLIERIEFRKGEEKLPSGACIYREEGWWIDVANGNRRYASIIDPESISPIEDAVTEQLSL